MTEKEWQQADDPEPMLELLRGKASGRKLILFMVYSLRQCRSKSHNTVGEMREESIRLELAERYADGLVPLPTIRGAWGGEPSYPETPYLWTESFIRRTSSAGVLLKNFPSPSESIDRLHDIFGRSHFAASLLISLGSPTLSARSPRASTPTKLSTGCQCSRMRWRKPVASMPTSCSTAGAMGRTSAAAGS